MKKNTWKNKSRGKKVQVVFWWVIGSLMIVAMIGFTVAPAFLYG